MLTTAIEIDCTARKEVKFVWTGDNHYGSINACKKTAKRVIRHVEKHDCYWAHFGDGIEAIMYQDMKRNDFKMIDPEICPNVNKLDKLIDLEMDMFCEHYEPIKDKMLFMLSGNHEDRLRRMYSIDAYEKMAKRLKPKKPTYKRRFGTHALGYDGWVILFLKCKAGQTHRIDMYVHHGWASARTPGAIVNVLYRAFTSRQMDIFVVGHAHNLQILPRQTLYVNRSYDVVHRHQIGIALPSFMKTYSDTEAESYSGQRGYDPSYIGAVELTIDPDVFYLPGREGETPYQVRII